MASNYMSDSNGNLLHDEQSSWRVLVLLQLVITITFPLCCNPDYKLHTIQRALCVMKLEVTAAY